MHTFRIQDIHIAGPRLVLTMNIYVQASVTICLALDFQSEGLGLTGAITFLLVKKMPPPPSLFQVTEMASHLLVVFTPRNTGYLADV